jgi:hypothetical protein
MNAFGFNPNEFRRAELVYGTAGIIIRSSFLTQHNADRPVSFFLDGRKVLTVSAVALIFSSDLDLKEVHEPGSCAIPPRSSSYQTEPAIPIEIDRSSTQGRKTHYAIYALESGIVPPLTVERTKSIICQRQFGRKLHEYSADHEEAPGRDHERGP